jgi:transcriptional regulator with XRE-family HTH domain
MRSLDRPVATLVFSAMLSGLGTSAGWTERERPPVAASPAQQTNAGMPAELAEQAGGGIAKLRLLTGLTWEQLARLFGVSRRSLHYWAGGEPMANANEEHLQRLLALVGRIDRGSPAANRTVLMAVREDGSIPFDLLANHQYDRAVALLEHTSFRRADLPRPSAAAVAARAPRPPEELVGALHDRAHRTTGKARAARSVRVRGGR